MTERLLVGDGILTTGDRLARIETSIQSLVGEVRGLAATTDVKDLSHRLTFIERDYVPQASVTRYWRYIAAQSLIILGLGLGLVYELLARPR